MKTWRKAAKDFLREATLTDFWDTVREAKITKVDQQVLEARFVEGKKYSRNFYRTWIFYRKGKQDNIHNL